MDWVCKWPKKKNMMLKKIALIQKYDIFIEVSFYTLGIKEMY